MLKVPLLSDSGRLGPYARDVYNDSHAVDLLLQHLDLVGEHRRTLCRRRYKARDMSGVRRIGQSVISTDIQILGFGCRIR